MFFQFSAIACLILYCCGKVTGKVYMVPMASADDIINDTNDDEMSNMIKTGQIPENLLNDILAEAGNYMSIYNYNPSKFLKNHKLLVPSKRGGGVKIEKKMTNGIVSLTRPRFGKRAIAVGEQGEEDEDNKESNYNEIMAADLMSPLTKAIYVYLVKNYGIPINSKSPRSPQTKLFTKLTRPRFGKRSLYGPAAILKFIRRISFKGEHQGHS